MRLLNAIIFCTISLWLPMAAIHSQDAPAKKVEVTIDPKVKLATAFLKAIKSDDSDAGIQCWLQYRHIEEQVKHLPNGAPVPTTAEMEKIRNSLEKRNEMIRIVLPILRRALEKVFGSVDAIPTPEVVTNDVKTRGEQQIARSIDMVFLTKDRRKVSYHIVNGGVVAEQWYLGDKPDSILSIAESDGKESLVHLGDFATEDELQRLKKLGVK